MNPAFLLRLLRLVYRVSKIARTASRLSRAIKVISSSTASSRAHDAVIPYFDSDFRRFIFFHLIAIELCEVIDPDTGGQPTVEWVKTMFTKIYPIVDELKLQTSSTHTESPSFAIFGVYDAIIDSGTLTAFPLWTTYAKKVEDDHTYLSMASVTANNEKLMNSDLYRTALREAVDCTDAESEMLFEIITSIVSKALVDESQAPPGIEPTSTLVGRYLAKIIADDEIINSLTFDGAPQEPTFVLQPENREFETHRPLIVSALWATTATKGDTDDIIGKLLTLIASEQEKELAGKLSKSKK